MAHQPFPVGPRLRLDGIRMADVPSTNAGVNELQPFMLSLLQETIEFLRTVDAYYTKPDEPSLWRKKGKAKFRDEKKTGAPNVAIDVDLLSLRVPKTLLLAAVSPAVPAGAQAPSNAGSSAPASVNGGNDSAVGDVSDAAPAAAGAASDGGKGHSRASKRQRYRQIKVTPETWACRRSVHPNSATPGSASWDEFVYYMKDEHIETEDAMTESVAAAQKALIWPNAANMPVCDMLGIDEGSGPWTDFTLAAVEMQHKIGGLLYDRVFPVLQMSCRSMNASVSHEFIVISVPIKDWAAVPTPPGLSKKLSNGDRVVLGSYVSVERFRILPINPDDVAGATVIPSPPAAPQSAETPSGPLAQPSELGLSAPAPTYIEWTMATASHARGVVPLFLQTPFVPEKIAVDVPYFTKWMADRRKIAAAAAAAAVGEDADEPTQP